MIAEERRRSILQLIRKNGSARTIELADMFQVSDQTVRRDLLELEEKGLVRKTHGGAHAVDYQGASFDERSVLRMAEKQAIAVEAVRIIRPGTVVVLSPGTTTEAVARMISGLELTVLTNSLAVARALADSKADVRLTGGNYRPKGEALTGEWCIRSLEDVFADVAFIGVSGIDTSTGYTMTVPTEAAVARQFMRIAKKVVVVADSTKFHRTAEIVVAPVQAAHTLITDSGIPPRIQQSLVGCGVEVVVSDRRELERSLAEK